MADYIYLLHTRLTPSQQAALEKVREAARSQSMTVFLVGGAVRDLTTGSPIRDMDFAIQGNAEAVRRDLQAAGGTLIGEDAATQTLHFNFPGGVRLEVGSTLSATYEKPGKPVFHEASILDDLRRRDFTANAMAISLNDGSFGLLMDPLNGVADLENRELRLVSPYGFIEDPSRMIRAARFSARLGWQMEEKTNQRYETGKAEGHISALNEAQRRYELEEVFHEEDPLRVLRRLEAEGWSKVLFPAWTSAKVNEAELERLRDTIGQLESMGIYPDPSAAYFPLLTAKLAPKDVAALKSSFSRPGFAQQIDALEASAKTFGAQISAKSASAPSDTWKLVFASSPEAVLWLAHTTKSAPLQAKFKSFFGDWAQARNKIPYQLMQEMRITPALPGYDELVETLFYAVMDNKLDTAEAARAFLEPYSPPAPPPPVNLRRRAVKREVKATKSRSKKSVAEAAPEDLEIAAVDESTQVPAVAATKTAPAKGLGKSDAKNVAPGAGKSKSGGKSSVPAVKASAAATKVGVAPIKPEKETKGTATRQPAKKSTVKAVASKKAVPARRSTAAKAAATAKTAASTKKPAGKKQAAKTAVKTGAKNRNSVSKAKRPVAKKAATAPGTKKPVNKASKAVPARRPAAKAKALPVKRSTKPAAKPVQKRVKAAGQGKKVARSRR